MNARLKVNYVKKNKVSDLQQIQLFSTSLERRREYKLTANEKCLESVEVPRRNKKRHDEKFVKRDRNIHQFFGPVSKLQHIFLSSTTSPYINPNYKQTKIRTKKINKTNFNAIQYSTLQENTKVKYSGMSSAKPQKKKQNRFPKKLKSTPRPYTRSHQLHTVRQRITEYRITLKQKSSYRGLVVVLSNLLQLQNRTVQYLCVQRAGRTTEGRLANKILVTVATPSYVLIVSSF